MKWSKAASSYLEYLQGHEYASRGLDIPSHNLDEIIKIKKRVLRQFLDNQTHLTASEKQKSRTVHMKEIESIKNQKFPTRYEDPYLYSSMMTLYDDIRKAAVRVNSLADRKLFLSSQNIKSRQPLLGTLPTGELNAMAIAVPSKLDYLVVFEADLIEFCDLIGKVVGMSIPFTGAERPQGKESKTGSYLTFSSKENDIKQYIANNELILDKFQELLLSYLLKGSPSMASQYLPNGPSTDIGGRIAYAMDLFVMGHEYSHIKLGHLADTENGHGIVATALASGEVEEIVYSWGLELEADLIGSLLSRTALLKRGYDFAWSHLGADLFFNCDDIIHRAISVLQTGIESNSENINRHNSHPPPKMRRDNLRSSLIADFGKESMEISEMAERIVETLWIKTQPLFLDLHRNGVKVHPHFSDWRMSSQRSAD